MADYSGGNVTAHIGADITDYQSAMRSVASSTQNAMQTTNQAFNSIGKTLAVTGAAITAIGVKSLNGFGGFQQSLNQAAVIAGGTAKDIQGLADVANKMGADLPLSAKDAADAMVAMARDGASIGTIKAEFPAIAQAATAAGSDLQQTASIVQQSMNLWGSSLQSPARAAAILTQTANASNATIEDMQQVLADVGGTAQSVGYSMQDVATSVGLLTNRGIPAAQAAQNMNFALTRMIKPSAQARDVMNQLGLTYYDSAGKMKPINQVAGELNQKLAGLTDQQKQNALSLLFGQAGYKVMNGLMQSVADTTGNATTSWDGMSKAIESASSTGEVATKFLQDQANEMQKNLGSKLEQVGGNWESLRNAAMSGSSGVLGSMADMISGAMQWASSTNSAVGSGIRNFLGLTPIIGAATLATGSFLTAATKIGSVMSTLGTAMKAMFLSPLGLAIVALGAFAGALSLAYKYSQPFRDAINNIAKAFSSVFGPAISNSDGKIKKFGDTVGGVMKSLGEWFGQKMANAINSVDWVKVFTKIQSLLQSVMRVAKQAVEVFSILAVKIANSGAASDAWNVFKSVLVGTYQAAKSLYQILKQTYDAIGNIGGAGSNTGKALQSAFAIISVLAVPIGLKMLPTLLGLILSPAQKLTGVFGGLLGKLNPFSSKTKSVADEVGKAKKPFSDFALKALEVGVGIGAAAAGFGIFASGVANLAAQGQQGTTTLMTFGVVVGLLAAEFALFGSSLTSGALGIGVFIGGMTALALAFTALAMTGSQGQATMITFGLVIAGLGVAFALLGPVLAAGAVGIAIFGAAMLAVGLGIGIASAGLALLATQLPLISQYGISASVGILALSGVILLFGAGALVASVGLIALSVGFVALGVSLVVVTVGISALAIGVGLLGVAMMLVSTATLLFGAGLLVISTALPMIAASGLSAAAALTALGLSGTIVAATLLILGAGLLAAGAGAVAFGAGALVASAGGVVLSGTIALIAGAIGLLAASIAMLGTSFVTLAAGMAALAATVSAIFSGIASFISNTMNSVANTIRGIWNGIASTISSMAHSAFGALRGAWGGLTGFVSGIWNGVKGAIHSAMNFDLGAAGRAIMDSFLGGLKRAWEGVKSFVGGIANWIKDHKGPISYDRKLLIPAGKAIMDGFGGSLNANFATVKQLVSSYAGQISDEFGKQQYVANAQLTTSSTGVAGQINGGLSALSDKVAEQQTQAPVFQVFNEIIGDKITTTVNTKNARRQATVQLMSGGV